MKKPTAFERNLAITDVETTGLDWHVHEILEIGVLIVDQNTFEVLDEFETKVRPEHIETADERSLEIAGYSDIDWEGALPIKEAMRRYADKVEGCIFLAHPMTVDFSFIDLSFNKSGVPNPMHYHQLDLFSMAWALKKEDERLPKVTLHELTKYFDLPSEPTPHRALNGARLALEILKRLVAPERA